MHLVGKYQDSSATVISQLPSSAVFRVIRGAGLAGTSSLSVSPSFRAFFFSSLNGSHKINR